MCFSFGLTARVFTQWFLTCLRKKRKSWIPNPKLSFHGKVLSVLFLSLRKN